MIWWHIKVEGLFEKKKEFSRKCGESEKDNWGWIWSKFMICIQENVRKKPTILYNKYTLIKAKKIITNCNTKRHLAKVKVDFFPLKCVCVCVHVHACMCTCMPMHVHVLFHGNWIPRNHLPELSVICPALWLLNILSNVIICWKIFEVFLNICENKSLGFLVLLWEFG